MKFGTSGLRELVSERADAVHVAARFGRFRTGSTSGAEERPAPG